MRSGNVRFLTDLHEQLHPVSSIITSWFSKKELEVMLWRLTKKILP